MGEVKSRDYYKKQDLNKATGPNSVEQLVVHV